MPGASYVNNWNNFDVDRVSAITSMFSELGYEVPDYHNASSHCSSTAGVENGNSDDILGLINFMRGRDYFDYNGNCKFDEVRDHVMGDVYHSQLIEVGPPDANVDFTNTNEEAYYRSIKGYQAFMTKHSAEKILFMLDQTAEYYMLLTLKLVKKFGALFPLLLEPYYRN